MNIDKSVFGVLSILVAVIVVATVAIPVIENSQSSIHTVSMNTNEYYTVQTDMDPLTIEFTNPATGEFKINGIDAKVGTAPYTNTFKLFGDTINIELTSSYSVFIDSATGVRKAITSGATFSMDANGSWTFDMGGSQTTGTTTVIVYNDPNGNYGYYPISAITSPGIYVTKGSEIYLASTGSGDPTIMRAKAIINDQTTTELIYALVTDSTTATPSSKTVTVNVQTSEIENNNLSLQITAASFLIDGSTTVPAQVYVPVEYKSTSNDTRTMVNVLSIIPLLLLIVPVMMAVRMYSSRGE